MISPIDTFFFFFKLADVYTIKPTSIMVLLIGLYSSVSRVFFSRSARSPWGLHWARGVGSLDILLRFGVDKYIQKKNAYLDHL